MLKDISVPEDRRNKMWSEQELEQVYISINTTLSDDDSHDLSEEIKEKYKLTRTPFSIYFIIIRMHAAMFGEFPYGLCVSETGNFHVVSKNIIEFCLNRGLNVYCNIEIANKGMAARIEQKKKMVSLEKAKKDMFTYYTAHKSSLIDNIKDFRDEIISDIMEGLSPSSAFTTYLK